MRRRRPWLRRLRWRVGEGQQEGEEEDDEWEEQEQEHQVDVEKAAGEDDEGGWAAVGGDEGDGGDDGADGEDAGGRCTLVLHTSAGETRFGKSKEKTIPSLIRLRSVSP